MKDKFLNGKELSNKNNDKLRKSSYGGKKKDALLRITSFVLFSDEEL